MHLLDLPPEVLVIICSHVDWHDLLCGTGLTSRLLHDLVHESNALWRMMYKKFCHYSALQDTDDVFDMPFLCLDDVQRHPDEASLHQSWKARCMRSLQEDARFSYGKVGREIMCRHNGWIMGCHVAADGTLATAGSDRKVIIWSPQSNLPGYEVVRILYGHTDWARCVRLSRDRIISGGCDKQVRLWDRESGALIQTMDHQGWVNAVAIGDDIALSGSDDHLVKLWRADNGNMLHEMRGHTDNVCCMDMCDSFAVSGGADMRIRLWDLARAECVHVLIGHTNWVRGVRMQDSLIISSASDKTLRVWDGRSPDGPVATLRGHKDFVKCVDFSGWKVVSGSTDMVIQSWDLRAMAPLRQLGRHDGDIECLAFSATKNSTITGGRDSCVLVHTW
eukprot:TRINITY_DN19160_c0_g1_i1.p1 TRINITY_DN19160_c0_g1~~TRINITY_DN19160_c0_g1_i1.p1  ORF type:complete len:391 (-),score=39.10 TRINITY_DN19160_c0_g1_i1:17-1189(-)